MNENDGVLSVWVKYYDCFGRLWEDYSLRRVDEGRRKYERLVNDQSVSFAQWGAQTRDGSIVLGEFRRYKETV